MEASCIEALCCTGCETSVAHCANFLGFGCVTGSHIRLKVAVKHSSCARLCVSYDEMTGYKQSVMRSDVDNLPPCFPSHFTQFSGDNVNHQTVTLDGCGTFHGMGVISMTTPCSPVTGGHFSKPVLAAVKRVRHVTVDRIIKNRGVLIASYKVPEITALLTLKLKLLQEVTHSLTAFNNSRKISLSGIYN